MPDFTRLRILPDNYLSFYANRMHGKNMSQMIERQKSSFSMDVHKRMLRNLKHEIFTGEHEPIEEQIKKNDNSCNVKISRRQMELIARLHKEHEIPYAE